MRVWHLSSNRWNSAITEYALSAARALEIAGCKSIFTPLAGSPAEARARGYGLETLPLAHFGPGAAKDAATVARAVKADVIVTYGGPETVLARFGGVRGAASVVRFRGQDVEPRVLGRMRQRFSHTHVARLIAPSEMIARKLRDLDPKKPVETVVLGCDAEKFTRTLAAAPGGRPEIVVLGRLDPVKGHGAAVALLKRTLEGGVVRPRLHIVGEPANLAVKDVEAHVAAQGLALGEDVVITATRVEGIARILSQAAVGLVPSLGSEIICRVAEEFLLCGTPVVVSGAGSLGEVLAFDGAGASYSGQSEPEATALLAGWVARSVAEGEDAKMRRAEEARRIFSLAAMGRHLKATLL